MASGVPIAIAMCIASLLYIWMSGLIPPLTVIHRMVGGVDSFPLLAVPFFILRRQPDELGRHHQPDLQFRAGAGRLAQGRARPRQRRRQRDLRRHVGHRDRRRRRPRHDRDQGDAGPRLPDRVRRRHHRGVGHAGADHPAVAADGDLRRAGQHLDRQALRRRLHSRRADGAVHDGHGRLLRARPQIRRRHRVLVAADGPRVRRARRHRRRLAGAVLPVVERDAGRLRPLRRFR